MTSRGCATDYLVDESADRYNVNAMIQVKSFNKTFFLLSSLSVFSGIARFMVDDGQNQGTPHVLLSGSTLSFSWYSGYQQFGVESFV